MDVSYGAVESIRKVSINIGQNNYSDSGSEESREIKQYLNSELKIPQDVITVSDGR